MPRVPGVTRDHILSARDAHAPISFARKRQLLVLIRNAQTIAVVSFHPKTQSLGDAESIVGLSDMVTAVLAPVYQVTIQTCPPI